MFVRLAPHPSHRVCNVGRWSTFTKDFIDACIASPRIRSCKQFALHRLKIFFPLVLLSDFDCIRLSPLPPASFFSTMGGEQRWPFSYWSHLPDARERGCVLFLAYLLCRDSVERPSTSIVHNSVVFFPHISLDIEAFAQHRRIWYVELVIRIDIRSFTYVLSCGTWDVEKKFSERYEPDHSELGLWMKSLLRFCLSPFCFSRFCSLRYNSSRIRGIIYRWAHWLIRMFGY